MPPRDARWRGVALAFALAALLAPGTASADGAAAATKPAPKAAPTKAAVKTKGRTAAPPKAVPLGPWHLKPPPPSAPSPKKRRGPRVRNLKPTPRIAPPPPWAEMDDVSTSGPGGATVVFDVPRSLSVVTSRDMAERAVASTPDAVADVPGVWVQKPYFGSGTAYVRGLGGRRVLVLENGLRLDDAARQAVPDDLLNSVDPFSLARIEVLRGPATVLYGEGALGGVVSLVEKTPAPGPKGLKGDAVVQVASQDWEKGLDLAGEVDAPFGAARVSASYNGFDDLESSVAYLKFTGYQRADFLAQGVLKLGEGRLSAGWSGGRQFGVPRTDRCKTFPNYVCTVDPQVFRDLYHLRYRVRLGPVSRLVATAYLRVRHQSEDMRRDDLFLERLDTLDVLSPGTRVEVRTRLLPHLRLTAGLDAETDRISDRTVLEKAGVSGLPPQRPRLPTGAHRERAGLFALGSFHLGRVDLFGGARVLTIHDAAPALTGFAPVDASYGGAVGTAGLRARIGGALEVVADVGQGFRAPNLDDLAGFGPGTVGYEVPAAGLKPERSTTFEVGVKVFGRRVQAQVFGYETSLSNAIITVPGHFGAETALEGLPVLTLRNIARAQLWGADLDASLVLPYGLSVGVGAAFTEGDDLTRGVPFPRVPPPFGRFRLRYTDRDQTFYSELVVIGAEAQTRLAPEDLLDPRICNPKATTPCTGTPGFFTFGLRLGVKLSRAATMSVYLENLVNEHYRIHGSGLDAPAMGAGVRVTVHGG